MSQILNSGSISLRLLILILSLFQCLCYREHITAFKTTDEYNTTNVLTPPQNWLNFA